MSSNLEKQAIWLREEAKRRLKRRRNLISKEFASFELDLVAGHRQKSIVWGAPFRLWPAWAGLEGSSHTHSRLAELGLAAIFRLDKPLVFAAWATSKGLGLFVCVTSSSACSLTACSLHDYADSRVLLLLVLLLARLIVLIDQLALLAVGYCLLLGDGCDLVVGGVNSIG